MKTSDALILRTTDFSETSCIVTALTRNFGKIVVLAKGGRRLKGPFENSLDILTRNSFTYISKRGGALDLLTESKLQRRFRVSADNLSGAFAAQYVADLLNLFCGENTTVPAVYDLAGKALSMLETGRFVMRTLVRFEGHLLRLTGHFPALQYCANCNAATPRAAGQRITFAPVLGGVLCRKCSVSRQDSAPVQPIMPETLNTFERLLSVQDKAGAWKTLPVSSAVNGEIRTMLNAHISNCAGTRPKTQDWLRLC